jgi:acyl-CoA thioester hydrolase
MDYPLIHTAQVRVNYFDTDQMGVVWHGNYIKYFEMAREELFRTLGLPYSEVEKTGIMMPIVDVSVEYKYPAHYDEVLSIETRVAEPPRSRIRVEYVITNPQGETVVTGSTTLAFIDSATRRPCRPPAALRQTGRLTV